jgi:hypothetical protein
MGGLKNFAIRHLEPRFYGALWCLGAVAIVVIAVLAYNDVAGNKDEIAFAGAMLAIVIATIGWIWSGRMSIMMARKTNAIGLLQRLATPEINELKDDVYPYIEAYDKFKREDDCDSRPKMPELAIQKLLGVYEQIAVSVIHGAVDHEIVKQSQSLVFKRIYCGLRHHIERVQEKSPDYFENFEKLTCTWHPDLQKRPTVLVQPGGLFAPMRDADA